MTYIILAVHNQLLHTKRFIACVKRQTYKPITVIVVDSGTDDAYGWVLENYSSVIAYCRPADTYWGGAMQYAYEYLEPRLLSDDTVLIMNNDGTFSSEFVRMGRALSRNGRLLVAESFDNGKQFDGGVRVDWKHLSFKLSENPNICSTRGLFMTGKDFMESGGFSKRLPHYHSDYEFTHRLWKKGFQIFSDPRLRIDCDGTCTGIVKPKNLRELFNIRCPNNPVWKSVFILLSSPARYWLVNLLRAWYQIFKT